MPHITITDVPPFDGEYDLNISTFTNRELHTIKQISGVRAGELKEAGEAMDNDLLVAFTVIALRRTGQFVDPDQIWDADLGSIKFRVTDEEKQAQAEAEKRPPSSASPSGSENESAVSDAPTEPTHLSGPSSDNDGEQLPSRPSLTGLRGSEPSAELKPESLAS